MPFSLLSNVPLVGLVRSPIRFVIITYVALGILAGWGLYALLSGGTKLRKAVMVGGAIGLVLLEMPLRTRYLEPVEISASMASLGQARESGAVLELPLTQHGRVDVHRMLYQTVHGRPITSAYVSRDVIDPYMHAPGLSERARNIVGGACARYYISDRCVAALEQSACRKWVWIYCCL